MIIEVLDVRTGRMAGGWQIICILLESIRFEMQREIQMDSRSSPASSVLCPLWFGGLLNSWPLQLHLCDSPLGKTLLFHLLLSFLKYSLSFKILFRSHILPNPFPVLPSDMHSVLLGTLLLQIGLYRSPPCSLFCIILCSIFEAGKSRAKFLILFTISRLFHTTKVYHVGMCVPCNILS